MTNNTFALIVGIDNYDNEDIGALKGSRNDAVHWYRLCRRFLDIPAEQITVLASPPLTAADLGDGADKSALGAADRAAILAAAEGLAKALSKGGAEGLVTYSGHGVVAGHASQEIEGADLAICPEDVARQPDGSFDRVIRFGELAEVFTRHNVRDALTVFFDTCYTGSGDADAPPARHLLGNQASPVADTVKKALAAEADAIMASRLILGARHWKPAYEVRTGSGYRGAASFAMTTLLEQWSTKSADGVTYFNVSYGDLIHRARQVIEALGFDQQPFMWGLRQLDDLPVFKHGLAITPGETSEKPDGQKDDRQIPVDTGNIWSMVFSDTNGTYAQVIATNNLAGTTSASDTEYWYSNLGTNGLGVFPSTGQDSVLTLEITSQTPTSTRPEDVQSTIDDLKEDDLTQSFSNPQTLAAANWLSSTTPGNIIKMANNWRWYLYTYTPSTGAPIGLLLTFGSTTLNGVYWFYPGGPPDDALPMALFEGDSIELTLVGYQYGSNSLFDPAAMLASPWFFSEGVFTYPQ